MTAYTFLADQHGADDLRAQIKALADFTVTGKQPILAAVNLAADGYAYATDTYILGRVRLPWEGGELPSKACRSWNVDARAFGAAARGRKRAAIIVGVDPDARTVTVGSNGMSTVLPMIEGTYPDMAPILKGPLARTYEDAVLPQTLNGRMLGRFGALAKAVAPHTDPAEGLRIIAAPGREPTRIDAVDGTFLGIIMPIMDEGSPASIQERTQAAKAEREARGVRVGCAGKGAAFDGARGVASVKRGGW